MRTISSIFFISLSILLFAQNQPKYEFRAAWVATVSNIDWPSKPGLSVSEQKKEVVEILDLLQQNGMNAVILQVRPASDAIYPSSISPWSRYLTGIPGVAPKPYYDPLLFWIEESHKRGMELHAWFNPFRVVQNDKETLAGNHIAFKHPDWIIKYGDRLYFDPGNPEVKDYLTDVVKEVVSVYDIDAIHFDDYFYPYPLKEEFPDTLSFQKYNRGFTNETKADWRRHNVDTIIKTLSDTIKAIKPWVKFGISPFGVWRNYENDSTGSNTKAGITNYDHLYADVIKWQREGWIDYLIPQLYWHIGHPAADYKTLTDWWKIHGYSRGMYIGHGLYRIDENSTTEEWKQPGQIERQISLLREIPEIKGSAFYSSKHFKRNLLGFQDSLKNNYYKYPAIVPPMSWIDDTAPQPPLKLKKRGKKIKWTTLPTNTEGDKQIRFVIYKNQEGQLFDKENVQFIDQVTTSTKVKLDKINKKRKKYEIRVSALDRGNNESEFSDSFIMKL